MNATNEDYIPESNEIDFEEMKSSPNFKRKKYNDAIYLGMIVKGKRDGKGVMIYKNGRLYEGDWKNDVRDGRGYERYSNGNYYIGMFSKGKVDGKGVYTWIKLEEVYDGEWIKGQRHGYGIWKS